MRNDVALAGLVLACATVTWLAVKELLEAFVTVLTFAAVAVQ